MDTPLISVVIPFYKGERFIAETLDSIFNQEHEKIEVILVNDGSPEFNARMFDRFGDRLKILTQENKGQAAARNTGLRAAKGSVIGLIDQDDIWPAGRITLMLPYLLSDNSFDFVRGMAKDFSINESGVKKEREPIFQEALIGTALYKKHVFERTGLFDESMRVGEDFDWNIRLRESGCSEKRLSDVTLLVRRHDANQSDTKDFIKNGQLRSLRQKLMRARKKEK